MGGGLLEADILERCTSANSPDMVFASQRSTLQEVRIEQQNEHSRRIDLKLRFILIVRPTIGMTNVTLLGKHSSV